MKSVKLAINRYDPDAPFQIKHLGLHEKMPPCLIDRPEGTRDYLFMLFHEEVTVRLTDGERVRPRFSLVVWTPPDSHYYGTLTRSWDHSWFHCSGREVESILKVSRTPVHRCIPVTDSSVMEHFLLEVIAELAGWSQPNGNILRKLFENFVYAVTRQSLQKSQPLAPASLLAVRAYVEQHFTERPRLGHLAKRAGWSEPHLCTEFRRFFGIPVIQYALQLRMNQAAYLLRDHNRRIGEIAVMLDYPDLYSFSKMFKQYLGVSPKRFRELNSQGKLGMRPRKRRAGEILSR